MTSWAWYALREDMISLANSWSLLCSLAHFVWKVNSLLMKEIIAILLSRHLSPIHVIDYIKITTLQRKLNFWLCIHKASCIWVQHFSPVVSRCTTELLHPNLHKLLRGLGLCLIYNKQFQQDQASPWPLLKIFFTPNYLTVTGQTAFFKLFRSLQM